MASAHGSNPDQEKLSRENWVVLYAVQAFLGIISQDIRAIALYVLDDEIIVHFAIYRQSAELADDINEMIEELDVQFKNNAPLITSQIFIGEPYPAWLGLSYRMIYWAKEQS